MLGWWWSGLAPRGGAAAEQDTAAMSPATALLSLAMAMAAAAAQTSQTQDDDLWLMVDPAVVPPVKRIAEPKPT